MIWNELPLPFFKEMFIRTRNRIRNVDMVSASSRISKGQGCQSFLRKKAGSSFGQKRAIHVIQGKT
jgi:hypothetical protein